MYKDLHGYFIEANLYSRLYRLLVQVPGFVIFFIAAIYINFFEQIDKWIPDFWFFFLFMTYYLVLAISTNCSHSMIEEWESKEYRRLNNLDERWHPKD